jgi:hypothetical protein
LKPTTQDKAIGTELRAELDDIKKKNKKDLEPFLTDVETQQKKVAAARLKGNETEIATERAMLSQRLKAYEDKVADQTTKKGSAQADYYKDLEKRLKNWEARAQAVKTDTYVEVGLHNNIYPWFSIGEHADHEATEQIRKGNMSDIDKALKTLGDQAKKGAEAEEKEGEAGAATPPPTPAAGPAASGPASGSGPAAAPPAGGGAPAH